MAAYGRQGPGEIAESGRGTDTLLATASHCQPCHLWSHQAGLKLLRLASLTHHPELHGELLCAKAQVR